MAVDLYWLSDKKILQFVSFIEFGKIRVEIPINTLNSVSEPIEFYYCRSGCKTQI